MAGLAAPQAVGFVLQGVPAGSKNFQGIARVRGYSVQQNCNMLRALHRTRLAQRQPFIDSGHAVSYLIAMGELLAVSEVAERVAPAGDPGAMARVLRQLRHWTLLGILPPAEGLHTGAGRHRRYEASSVYLAALLVELTSIGLTVGGLKAVSAVVHRLVLRTDQYSLLWGEAISGAKKVWLHLHFRLGATADRFEQAGADLFYDGFKFSGGAFWPPETTGFAIQIHAAVWENESSAPAAPIQTSPAILVDLTGLFARVGRR